jgi:hypothetical protein
VILYAMLRHCVQHWVLSELDVTAGFVYGAMLAARPHMLKSRAAVGASGKTTRFANVSCRCAVLVLQEELQQRAEKLGRLRPYMRCTAMLYNGHVVTWHTVMSVVAAGGAAAAC